MDMKEMLTQTSEELVRLLGEAERTEQDLRRKLALRSYTKTADALTARREVARLQTAIAQQKRSPIV
jgi:ribosomal protein L29